MGSHDDASEIRRIRPLASVPPNTVQPSLKITALTTTNTPPILR
jgi:hypothetical protein